LKITAIIPTFNEEIHIENAIKSVSFADEIIVIDSYSTDRTVELAKKYDIQLIQRVFDDFSTQKNYAIDKAVNDWIYVLDADERVTPKLREELLEAVKGPKDFVGFYVYRTFYFIGRKINYGGSKRDKVIRLFLKSHCRYNGNPVHEVIKTDGKVGFLNTKLEHYSYRGFDHFISKLNQYSWLRAKQLHEQNKKVSLFHIVIKPPVRFFIEYFIRLGFLDGFPGFVLAVTQSYGVLARYIKLWLINNNLK
jgi:glycosyltransferase involved in cell wall biosynthesis